MTGSCVRPPVASSKCTRSRTRLRHQSAVHTLAYTTASSERSARASGGRISGRRDCVIKALAGRGYHGGRLHYTRLLRAGYAWVMTGQDVKEVWAIKSQGQGANVTHRHKSCPSNSNPLHQSIPLILTMHIFVIYWTVLNRLKILQWTLYYFNTYYFYHNVLNMQCQISQSTTVLPTVYISCLSK